LFRSDAMVVVHGKFERDDESSRLLVSDIVPLDLVRERAVKAVEIRLGARVARDTVRELAGVLDRYPGDRGVSLVVEVGPPESMRVRMGTARRIKPSDLFVKDVEGVCGAGAVVLK